MRHPCCRELLPPSRLQGDQGPQLVLPHSHLVHPRRFVTRAFIVFIVLVYDPRSLVSTRPLRNASNGTRSGARGTLW
jgi:hypothetical protein